MNCNNYHRLSNSNIFRSHYLFIDTHACLGKEILDRYQLRVKVQRIYEKKNTDYIIVHVTLPPRKETEFEKAMEELEKKALLLGEREYPEFCKYIFGTVLSKYKGIYPQTEEEEKEDILHME